MNKRETWEYIKANHPELEKVITLYATELNTKTNRIELEFKIEPDPTNTRLRSDL